MPAFLPSFEASSVVAEHSASLVIPKSDSTSLHLSTSSISTLTNPTCSSRPQDPPSTTFSTPALFESKRVPAPDVQRSINKAAASLKLIHVPSKVSCDIQRRFYNSTGGVN
ncbi:hypothetical protein BGX34_002685 [Mortierella sp. NVP85]|nr:hypothetical protein BGX34_002685 [Mortierella sp. NVP85]